MHREGFENYAAEWWHFTFKPEPTPTTAYDVPIHSSGAASDTLLSRDVQQLVLVVTPDWESTQGALSTYEMESAPRPVRDVP
jgi:hypothetical protein